MAYVSQYPAAYNDTYIKVTSFYQSTSAYNGYWAANPSTILTGVWDNRAWVANAVTNQRWHIDLGSAKVIKRIYYENGVYNGSYTGSGLKNFTFWGSNTASAFADTTYATDTNWTQLTAAQSTFDQHVAANTVDPKYMLITNSTAYQYYAVKVADNWGDGSFLAVRRIELQIDDAPTTPKGRTLMGAGL